MKGENLDLQASSVPGHVTLKQEQMNNPSCNQAKEVMIYNGEEMKCLQGVFIDIVYASSNTLILCSCIQCHGCKTLNRFYTFILYTLSIVYAVYIPNSSMQSPNTTGRQQKLGLMSVRRKHQYNQKFQFFEVVLQTQTFAQEHAFVQISDFSMKVVAVS